MDKETIIKQLLEAGVHFGHQTRRWNPKMQRYIFGERQGIHIIDLEKTANAVNEACRFVTETASNGEYILFVGTKKQAKDIVRQEASRCEMFYVNERWIGGTLTNFSTIRKSASRLLELRAILQDSNKKLTKKESARLTKEEARLAKNLDGIVKMDKLPGVIFIIDSAREETAVNEACRLSIPTVAICDTNSNPDRITYAIPGNDDAIRSISLITHFIADAIIEGRKLFTTKGIDEIHQTQQTQSENVVEAQGG